MKIAFFDTHRYERETFGRVNAGFGYEFDFIEPRLTAQTASLASGAEVVCSFVNDRVDREAIEVLKECGTKLIALRCAGFNHVDLRAANELGLPVVRVPEYSPHAVAEHALALVLTLVRKTHRAYNRVRELNFSLEGLVGFDLHGKTVGVIGTGRIGRAFAGIMKGFGCEVLAYDLYPDKELLKNGVRYVDLPTLYRESSVISLHVPLTPETRHLISREAIARMHPGVIIVNTGRGALIDTRALIEGLKSGHVGGACLDVYEEEEGVFFRDLSEEVLQDDLLARLLTFPNVLITSHQAFLTREALGNIAMTTLGNIQEFEKKKPLTNEIKAAVMLA